MITFFKFFSNYMTESMYLKSINVTNDIFSIIFILFSYISEIKNYNYITFLNDIISFHVNNFQYNINKAYTDRVNHTTMLEIQGLPQKSQTIFIFNSYLLHRGQQTLMTYTIYKMSHFNPCTLKTQKFGLLCNNGSDKS